MSAITAPTSFSTRLVLVLAAALAVLLPGHSAQADTLNVCSTCEYTSIQDAIDSSVDGDLILVEPGTYYRGSNPAGINTYGKAITIQSTGGPEVTFLDAEEQSAIRVTLFEGRDTIIDGFTCLNAGYSCVDIDANATIRNCIFRVVDNSLGPRAIDLKCCDAYPLIEDCVFDGLGTVLNNPGYNSPGYTCTFMGCSFTYGDIQYNGASVSVRVENCSFTNCGIGSDWTYDSALQVVECHFSNSNPGVSMGETDNTDVQITGCTSVGSDSGAYLLEIQQPYFVNNTVRVEDCVVEDVPLAGAYTSLSSCTLEFIGCSVTGNLGEGVPVLDFSQGGSADFRIESCDFSGCDAIALSGDRLDVANSTFDALAGKIDVNFQQGEIATSLFANTSGLPSCVIDFTGGGDNEYVIRQCAFVDNATDASTIFWNTGACTLSVGNSRFCNNTPANFNEPPVDLDGNLYDEDCQVPIDFTVGKGGDFSDIQDAIDGLGGGSIVNVLPGTYGPVNFNGKSISLISVEGPATTIIDGGGVDRAVRFTSGETSGAMLDGFTITNGYSDTDGGGILVQDASPTIRNCVITGNQSDAYGGGMCIDGNSTMTLSGCTFSGNSAESNGGGLFFGYPWDSPSPQVTLEQCVFSGNDANQGGGAYGSGVFNDCIFENNVARNGWTAGGGLYGGGQLTNCQFVSNTTDLEDDWYSGSGGGMVVISDTVLDNCTFLDNTAGESGGGLFLTSDTETPSLAVIGGSFTGNQALSFTGGGLDVYAGSGVSLQGVLVTDNTSYYSGGGMFIYVPSSGNAAIDGCTITHNNALNGYYYNSQVGEGGGLFLYGDGILSVSNTSLCSNGPDNLLLDQDTSIEDLGSNNFQANCNCPKGCIIDGSSYASLQEAVDEAFNGDVIELPPGTYSESIVFWPREITLRSTDGPEVTVIDGGGTSRVLDLSGLISFLPYPSDLPGSITIEGLTISGGLADEGAGMYVGYTFSAQVRNCVIRDNHALEDGGGFWQEGFPDEPPMIEDSMFIGNSAGDDGGGSYSLYDGSTQYLRCHFESNVAGDRGGGALAGPLGSFRECTFSLNDAFNGGAIGLRTSEGYGGGPVIEDCTFTGNTAHYGGGIQAEGWSEPVITSCTFHANTAYFGGGYACLECTHTSTDDVDFIDNQAFYGGAIYTSRGPMDLANTRFSGNGAYQGGAVFQLETVSTFSGTLFGGNIADDAGGAVYNLVSVSEIDATLFCSNEAPSAPDIFGAWSDNGGVIFEAECLDCNGNGSPDWADIELDPSLDCNGDSAIDSCQIAGDPSLDCNGNTILDVCDIADGTSADLNGNGIPDECEDCNYNEIPDDMDLVNCDGSPWCSDCNGNGVLDGCDIANGTSVDDDLDGIPDECQCLADIVIDGIVNVTDLLNVIANWNQPGGPADVNFDGIVNVADLLIVIASWGPCS